MPWDADEKSAGARGVGTPLETCAPPACCVVNAPVRVMPVPEACAPAACARVSGATLPPVVETTTTVSRFAPLWMEMVWPPVAPATGITVAPGVPTAAMTADSRFAPVSIIIVWHNLPAGSQRVVAYGECEKRPVASP